MENEMCEECGHSVTQHRSEHIGTDIMGKSCCDCHCPVWVEQIESNHYWPESAKPDTSLELLVIDFGDEIIIKTIRGSCDIKLGGVTYQCRTIGHQMTSLYSFTELRAAIDAEDEKPVPRIEAGREGDLFRRSNGCVGLDIVMIASGNNEYRNAISTDQYNALCKIAGKTLDVYEPKQGTWTQLLGKPLPRIERNIGGQDEYPYRIINKEDWGSYLPQQDYDALCAIAGKTLDVYEPKRGEWTQLSPTEVNGYDIAERTGVEYKIVDKVLNAVGENFKCPINIDIWLYTRTK